MIDKKINGHSVRCYDNGGETVDRYAVYYIDTRNPWNGLTDMVGMSIDPFHHQGFGQHSMGEPGPHNGKRVKFSDLPRDCQRLVIRDLTDNVES
jgi:hypothetical protein